MHPDIFCKFTHSRIIAIVALFLAFIASSAYAYESECGTARVIENLINKRKQPQYYAQTSYFENNSESTRTGICTTEDYYDSVYTVETPHFQVMYVLNGPHATTKEFVDSTVAILESAWDFYHNKHKMRTPQSVDVSFHFQKEVKPGLYPIEIIEINQIRDNLIDGNGCGENFAITYPFDNNGSSEIFMENDFYVTCSYNTVQDTIFVHGDTCTYSAKAHPLQNVTHNFSYGDQWAKGLRVTIFHEYYHAIQLGYISSLTNRSFWFEASATGFEEITNPDIDDYFRYIPSFFQSMGSPLSSNFRNYGASTLFLYLYNKVSHNLDKAIWENYSKNPSKDFEYQIQKALKELKLDADSVFHDYAIRLTFSGNRSADFNEKEWINDDQSEWTIAKFNNSDGISPDIKSLAFDFYRTPRSSNSAPSLINFIGKASVIIYRDGEANIYNIQNTKSIDSVTSILASSDSSLWIFSRLGDSESIPIANSDAAPHAYPVPWRQGALCFAPLPRDKKFIEIRNRRGDLVTQEEYDGTSYCLSEDKVKSKMAPGIYRFRVGNKGKTTSFIVVY